MSSDAPRYVQIFNTLSRRMETGKYSVDTRLPTESELCDEFNDLIGFPDVWEFERRYKE